MRIIVEWISNLDHFRPIVIVILRGCVELIKFVCEQSPNLAVSFYIFYLSSSVQMIPKTSSCIV